MGIGGILAAYGWLVAPQLGKPLVYDDVNFALAAEAIARTGLPHGNQGYLLHLYDQQEQWALWHPPLYLYALGVTMALFGPGETAARAPGVLCQLVAAGFAFDLARRMATSGCKDATSGAVAGVLAVALFLLCPLTVQAALILDIDNTLLMVLLTVYVWLVARLADRWPPRTVVGFGLLYAVSLWTKLTTPFILLAGLAFTRLFQGIGVRGVLEALVVGALGWVLFAASWLAYTGLTSAPLSYTFDVAYFEAIESGASTRERFASLAAFSSGTAPAILWIGPFFCLLFVATGLPRLHRLLRGRGLEPSDLAIVLGAAIYLAYMVKLAGNFPKYHAAMLPLWAAGSGALVARSAGRPSWAQLAVAGVGLLAAGAWLGTRTPALWTIQFTPPLVRLLIVVPGLVGLALVGLWAQLGRANPLRAAPVALAVLTLAWSLALDVHQRGFPGSTTYFYGRHGQIEAARALDERLRPGELYVGAKEVAWYSHDRNFVDQDSWHHVVWELGKGFDGTWLGRDVRLLALEVGEPSFKAAYEGVLLPRYQVVGEFGNFMLFERTT